MLVCTRAIHSEYADERQAKGPQHTKHSNNIQSSSANTSSIHIRPIRQPFVSIYPPHP